jgi:hypothetical protein
VSVESHILKWIGEVSKLRPELGGLAICPFANKARFKIIECSIDDIEPIDGFDVVIFVVEQYHDYTEIQSWVNFYNRLYDAYEFFEDCACYDTYIGGIQTNNGKYNLILSQPKGKLRKYREILANTEYYSYWSPDYLREILGDDMDVIEG